MIGSAGFFPPPLPSGRPLPARFTPGAFGHPQLWPRPGHRDYLLLHYLLCLVTVLRSLFSLFSRRPPTARPDVRLPLGARPRDRHAPMVEKVQAPLADVSGFSKVFNHNLGDTSRHPVTPHPVGGTRLMGVHVPGYTGSSYDGRQPNTSLSTGSRVLAVQQEIERDFGFDPPDRTPLALLAEANMNRFRTWLYNGGLATVFGDLRAVPPVSWCSSAEFLERSGSPPVRVARFATLLQPDINLVPEREKRKFPAGVTLLPGTCIPADVNFHNFHNTETFPKIEKISLPDNPLHPNLAPHGQPRDHSFCRKHVRCIINPSDWDNVASGPLSVSLKDEVARCWGHAPIIMPGGAMGHSPIVFMPGFPADQIDPPSGRSIGRMIVEAPVTMCTDYGTFDHTQLYMTLGLVWEVAAAILTRLGRDSIPPQHLFGLRLIQTQISRKFRAIIKARYGKRVIKIAEFKAFGLRTGAQWTTVSNSLLNGLMMLYASVKEQLGPAWDAIPETFADSNRWVLHSSFVLYRCPSTLLFRLFLAAGDDGLLIPHPAFQRPPEFEAATHLTALAFRIEIQQRTGPTNTFNNGHFWWVRDAAGRDTVVWGASMRLLSRVGYVQVKDPALDHALHAWTVRSALEIGSYVPFLGEVLAHQYSHTRDIPIPLHLLLSKNREIAHTGRSVSDRPYVPRYFASYRGRVQFSALYDYLPSTFSFPATPRYSLPSYTTRYVDIAVAK